MSNTNLTWAFQNIWPCKSLDENLWFIPWQRVSIRNGPASQFYSQHYNGRSTLASTVRTDHKIIVDARYALTAQDRGSGIVIAVANERSIPVVIGCYQTQELAMPEHRNTFLTDIKIHRRQIASDKHEVTIVTATQKDHIVAGNQQLAIASGAQIAIIKKSIVNNEVAIRRLEWALLDFRPRSIARHVQRNTTITAYELSPRTSVGYLEWMCNLYLPNYMPGGTYRMLHQQWANSLGADFDYDMDTPGFLKIEIGRDTHDMAVNPVDQERSRNQMEKKRRERNVEGLKSKEKNRRVEEGDERGDEEADGAAKNGEQEEEVISILATPSEAPSSPLSSAPSSPVAFISKGKAVDNENEGSRKTKKVRFSM